MISRVVGSLHVRARDRKRWQNVGLRNRPSVPAIRGCEKGYSWKWQRNLESSGNRLYQMRGDGNEEGFGRSTSDGSVGWINYSE